MIQRQSKSIIQHLWYYCAEYWWWKLKAWICIHLDQITLEILVNHNIQPKYFKVIHFSFRIDEVVCSMNHIGRYFSDLRMNRIEKVDLFLLVFRWVFFLNVFIKLLVWQFVSFLILSVVFAVFLNCVISQVNHWWVVVQVVFVRSSSNVSQLAKIPSDFAIYWADHDIMSNIKLTPFVKQRSIKILLNEKCLKTSIGMSLLLFYNGFNFVQILAICYSSTSVG